MVLFEACLDSYQSAVNASKAGCDRIELCGNLIEGGTTPSAGLIISTRKNIPSSIPIHVMIRPRGGDFLYSNDEFEIMKEDIKFCKTAKVEGIVFGILLSNGKVDVSRCKELVEIAKPMNITFHRAFDMTIDPFEALEDIISIGNIQRILTSGQESSALEGIDLIRDLIKKAQGRIIIMPGVLSAI
jgi:copper homeostasis protein